MLSEVLGKFLPRRSLSFHVGPMKELGCFWKRLACSVADWRLDWACVCVSGCGVGVQPSKDSG